MFTPRGEGARPLRRRRGHGGGRRAAAVSLTLLVLVTLAVLAWQTTTGGKGDDRARAEPTPSCRMPAPLPPVLAPSKVRVNVYNATDRRGLAAKVAGQLDRRRFRVGKVDNDPLRRTVTGAAEVRHGEPGAAAARVIAAQVGTVTAVPDGRAGRSVDLVLGADFTALVPPAEAAAALSPSPTPAGC
jgi:hypothetical protein